MKQAVIHEYYISGNYIEDGTEKHFNFVIEAPNNVMAMQMACGKVLISAESPITLKNVHYEVV
jgi:hypothetical protein